MGATSRCPHCLGPSRWEGNPYRPFCCERCRMIDLGHWLKGDYRLPEDHQKMSEEERAFLEKEGKDSTLH
jgi:uncharacterized protein